MLHEAASYNVGGISVVGPFIVTSDMELSRDSIERQTKFACFEHVVVGSAPRYSTS